jgi:hypothetical protein
VKWKPHLRTGVWVGSGIVLLAVLIDSGLLWRAVNGPLNGMTFICAFTVLLSLPAIVLVGYRMYDLMRLRYEFDRNQLTIVTAATKQIIPMDSIKQVLDGRALDLRVRMRSLVWPGYFFGQGHIDGIGLTLFYAVEPLSRQAIVVTPTLAYGISVPDMDSFMDVFEASRQIGASVTIKQESLQSPYVHWPIWQDRIAQGVLLSSLVLNALLFAILCFRYPKLPNLLPLHYDVSGRVDRISPRSEVFALPIIGLITWLANTFFGALLYRRERIVSYLAWSGALLVQIFFLLALWNIVS